mmetsp:Transcript_2303/g.3284  ORF Transcript_2303/g.3284 Transcript_2303/m.3284 type:complete len:450 (-) Transcript_2303:33-1382(-)
MMPLVLVTVAVNALGRERSMKNLASSPAKLKTQARRVRMLSAVSTPIPRRAFSVSPNLPALRHSPPVCRGAGFSLVHVMCRALKDPRQSGRSRRSQIQQMFRFDGRFSRSFSKSARSTERRARVEEEQLIQDSLGRLIAAGETEGEARTIAREVVRHFSRKMNERKQNELEENGREDLAEVVEAAINERIEKQTPLQYIIGEWDFLDLKSIKIRKPCLCPRPETEEMASMILDAVSPDNIADFRVLEIGSGTGALGLALLYRWVHMRGIQKVKLDAIDIAQEATELTEENARIFGLHDHVVANHVSFAEFMARRAETKNDQRRVLYHLIISNPPYIPSEEVDDLESVVKDHEDRRALDGGVDGMDLIRDILNGAHLLLIPGGQIWLEVDPSHPKMIQDYLASAATSSEGNLRAIHAERSLRELRLEDSIEDFMGNMRFVKLRRRLGVDD